ncbi:hypothetical protein RJT34_08283 [Clitoria ternatea]|uniref:AT-hook motif nuclear-localized protein n=1 Tax=Clitoria ternatea TaxID=43366 RepID=A0AAN9PVK6_CLITE
MSGSNMGPREQFTLGMHNPQPQAQPQFHQRLDFSSDGTNVYVPTSSVNMNGGGDSCAPVVPQGMGLGQAQGVPLNSSETVKKKRGRPRKYGPDGTMSLGLPTTTVSPAPLPASTASAPASGGAGAFPPVPTADSVTPGTSTTGKKRGRPKGSTNKKSTKASGSGSSFTLHVITVKAGEDLSSKLMSFAHTNGRRFCIMTASGSISNVTLRQPSTAGGTVTYEGRFEILNLGGSLFHPENDDNLHRRPGGLSVCLSGPDGRVLGGGVAGLLVAASTVQIILGTFPVKACKPSKSKDMEDTCAPDSPSRGTLSESSGGAGSPLNQSTGACNPSQGFSGMSWK